MFDFAIAEEPSVLQCVICTLAFLAVLLMNNNTAVKTIGDAKVSKQKERFFVLCFVLLAVFYMSDSDFFHYQQIVVRDLDLEDLRWNHVERVYTYITSFVDRNYFLFRVIVWGGASILLYFTVNRYLGRGYYGMFFLFASYFAFFSYGRVSLAMAIYFLGLSLLCKSPEKWKWLGRILGLALIGVSYEFHHSILVLIILTPLIFLPLNKWTVLIPLLLIPIVVIVLKDVLELIAMSELLSEETQEGGVSGRVSGILESSTSRANMSLLMSIRVFYGYLTFVVPFVLVTRKIFDKKRDGAMPIYLQQLYKVALGVFMASIGFMLIFGLNIMFYRILYMLMIPLSILMVGLRQYNFISYKSFVNVLYFNMVYMIIDYFYSIYMYL